MTLSTADKYTSLAFFLLKETGSVYGVWRGTMSAKDQRALFGRFLGKGTLIINGETERVKMIVKVCFGTDFDTRADIAWRDL